MNTSGFTIFVFLFSCITMLAQQETIEKIKNYPINFNGFALSIQSDAQDENGNHLLVGDIKVTEEDPALRDTIINQRFNLGTVYGDDALGILIVTDSNYNVLNVRYSFNGNHVIYDGASKQFIVGANFFDYKEVNNEFISLWQPIIIKTGLDLRTEVYFLERDYSCLLQHFEMSGDNLILYTRTTNNKILKERREKVEVVAVSFNDFIEEKELHGLKKFKELKTFETATEPGRVSITSVSRYLDTTYFVTSTLDQYDMTRRIHLYQFTEGQLKELPNFGDYLKRSLGYVEWVHLNEFYVDAEKNFHVLFHPAATKEEMTYIRMNKDFGFMLKKELQLEYYADYNRMILLTNGNTVVIDIDEQKNWRYSIYDRSMELFKRIESNLSQKYYPYQLKEINYGRIECIFVADGTSLTDCVVQLVDLK